MKRSNPVTAVLKLSETIGVERREVETDVLLV